MSCLTRAALRLLAYPRAVPHEAGCRHSRCCWWPRTTCCFGPVTSRVYGGLSIVVALTCGDRVLQGNAIATLLSGSFQGLSRLQTLYVAHRAHCPACSEHAARCSLLGEYGTVCE